MQHQQAKHTHTQKKKRLKRPAIQDIVRNEEKKF